MDSIENLSFEEALKALEDIVNKLETGQASLEDSVLLYEKGAKLKEHCSAKLKAAELKIQEMTAENELKPINEL